MALNKNQKYFVRVLKEIGVWHIWCIERKKRLHYRKIHNIPFKHFIPDNNCFSAVINSSFVWVETGYPKLWRELHDYSGDVKNEQLALDEFRIRGLKRIIKQII